MEPVERELAAERIMVTSPVEMERDPISGSRSTAPVLESTYQDSARLGPWACLEIEEKNIFGPC
jgi:hypothetical protein